MKELKSTLLIIVSNMLWNRIYKTDVSVISRLYNDDVKEIEIPFLSLLEQNRIASDTKDIETRIADIEDELALAEMKKKQIMALYIS